MRGRRARMGGITSFIDLLFILLFGMLALSDTKQATVGREIGQVRIVRGPGHDGARSVRRAGLLDGFEREPSRLSAQRRRDDTVLADLIDENMQTLAELEVLDNGCPMFIAPVTFKSNEPDTVTRL